jgi:hypothetical protein
MTSTVIETVLLSAHAGQLRYRVRTEQLPDGTHPDALARALTGFDLDHVDPARLLHSTSWRFDGGAVVLTYAALPDPDPATALPLKPDQTLPYAVDPLAPSLDRLSVHDVAVHACRHLAYLRQTDPVVSLTADEAPELWQLIGGLSPTMAGLVTQPDVHHVGIAP